jgi:hypothetical protein
VKTTRNIAKRKICPRWTLTPFSPTIWTYIDCSLRTYGTWRLPIRCLQSFVVAADGLLKINKHHTNLLATLKTGAISKRNPCMHYYISFYRGCVNNIVNSYLAKLKKLIKFLRMTASIIHQMKINSSKEWCPPHINPNSLMIYWSNFWSRSDHQFKHRMDHYYNLLFYQGVWAQLLGTIFLCFNNQRK